MLGVVTHENGLLSGRSSTEKWPRRDGGGEKGRKEMMCGRGGGRDRDRERERVPISIS